MPYIKGLIIPEIKSAGLLNKTLRILIYKPEAIGNQQKTNSGFSDFEVLAAYLESIPDSSIRLHVTLYTDKFDEYKTLAAEVIKASKSESNLKDEINRLANIYDADIVVFDNAKTLFPIDHERPIPYIIADLDSAKKEIEFFVRGHEIPWSFSQPLWNMPWGSFYSMGDEVASSFTQKFYPRIQNLKIGKKLYELARFLIFNTMTYICYTRDKSHFYQIQRNYAMRRKWERQSFRFEAGYYLNNYYTLLWGGMDQLARLINYALNLNVSPKIKINLGSPKYVAKILPVDRQLGEIFTSKTFTDWISRLKDVRHFISHSGVLYLGDLVEIPKNETPEEELDDELNKRSDIQRMRKSLNDKQFQQYYEFEKTKLKYSKYSKVRDDAMVINTKDYQYVFFPLIDIDWNFETYITTLNQSLSRILDILESNT